MVRVYSLDEKENIRKYWDSIVMYMNDDVREYTHNHSEHKDIVYWLDGYLDNAYRIELGHYKEFIGILFDEFGVDLR